MDEENLGGHFADYELEDALAHASDSPSTQSSPYFQHTSNTRRGRASGSSRWGRTSSRHVETDEGDDEVPASLLVEGDPDVASPSPPPPPPPIRRNRIDNTDASLPGPSTPQLRHKWMAERESQPLRPPSLPNPAPQTWNIKQRSALAYADPKERAMWRWANVEDLDNFLKDVYVYFLGNGIWCIVLSRLLNIM